MTVSFFRFFYFIFENFVETPQLSSCCKLYAMQLHFFYRARKEAYGLVVKATRIYCRSIPPVGG